MLGVKKCAPSQGFRDRSDVIEYLWTHREEEAEQPALLTSCP